MKEEVRLKTKKKIATETVEKVETLKKNATPFGSWLKKIMVASCRIRRPKI